MSYYTGNETGNSANIGVLPAPYYWWEAGAMWGAMIDYQYYTGDTTYNDIVAQAILSQVSPTNDFMMPAQHFDLGNDDVLFWALTAMSAAEYAFPNPSSSGPAWIDLAINVFTDMTQRWNTTQCNGGLKWQFFPSNTGYDYKSSVTNGGFFQLSARLARYTGNQTYVDWTETIWEWMTGVGLVSDSYNVYDGANDLINCSQLDHDQWTYNNAMFVYGAAVLTNITTDDSPWANRTAGFLQVANNLFFSPYTNATNIMFEAQCEKTNTCNTDQFSFKAYESRWLYATAKMLPYFETDVLNLMVPTAQAAAQSCSGGSNGRTCGTRWWYEGWDGAVGLGQQMSALEAIHGLLINTVDTPGLAASASESGDRRRNTYYKRR
ncbi:hydrolase 76 protein [Ptychographa xylographoides]|nr:hydrolase 76 protein [Ptychographa xylographoides]